MPSQCVAARVRRSRAVPSPRAAMLWILSACFCLALPAVARAQVVNGTLLGNVHDSSNAAIPGATVTATEINTNATRSAVTNETGNYILSNLRDGTYRLEAELTGVKDFDGEPIGLLLNA